MSKDTHQIGMAQLVVAPAPAIIRSSGLGSCLGIVLYDPFARAGGMAHAMLPAFRAGRQDNKAKYVDTAIELMLAELDTLGSIRQNIIAKLAGGAQMFPDADKDILIVGQKNIAAGRACLEQLGIPIIAEDTGGTCGRTLQFDCSDGSLSIQTTQKTTKI